MQKAAIMGAVGQGKALALSQLHEVKDLIVTPKPVDETPLQRIVIKPFHYAYMRPDSEPTPEFFRTRHRKQH